MRRSVTFMMLAASSAFLAGLLPFPVSGANQRCDGAEHDCDCAPSTICWCCNEDTSFGETCGNCVWWTWHEACCHWDVALAFCGNANTWDDSARSSGLPVGGDAQVQSIFVRESGTWGHVGWVYSVYPDGGWDSTEMMCGGPCGILDRRREVGYANAFIYNPNPTPEEDEAEEVDEPVEMDPEPPDDSGEAGEPAEDAMPDLAPDPVDDAGDDTVPVPDAGEDPPGAPYDIEGGCACVIGR